jgi:hypothetical protein
VLGRVTPVRADHVNLTRQAEDCSPYQFDRPQAGGYNICEFLLSPQMTAASIASRQKHVFIAENSSATY